MRFRKWIRHYDPPMSTAQGGIFALGTASHAYLEFDATGGSREDLVRTIAEYSANPEFPKESEAEEGSEANDLFKKPADHEDWVRTGERRAEEGVRGPGAGHAEVGSREERCRGDDRVRWDRAHA